MTQAQALAILQTGANVFLTGEPGSGKTYAVNRFVAWLRERGLEPAVTASTGIAATHINGHTIHSWSGIGVRTELTKFDLNRIVNNQRVVNRVRAAHTLIIDEISMLSAQTFGMVETACRAVRGGTVPFGGLQVVLVGDFFQLPPVTARDEENSEGQGFWQMRAGLFAFDSPTWSRFNPTVCYLSEQYRQEDPVFLGVLSAIRSGTVSSEHRALLQARSAERARDGVTQFFSHNAEVDRVNRAKLSQLPGEERAFAMEKHGAKQLVERLVRGCLSPEILTLKIGARVMFTKNDIAGHRFVNGTLGTIVGFSEEDGEPIVKTGAGRTIFAEPAEWSVEEGGRILARIIQIPLRLAWAITVHKSQGMSLDAAHMDLSDAFEHGQGYVAISRVRTLQGLFLAGFNERALQVHPDIAAKDLEFREASRQVQENLAAVLPAELKKRQDDFIRAGGGNVEPLKGAGSADDNFIIVANAKKKSPCWEQTLESVRAGKTVEEAARAQGRKPATIIQHIEELLVLEKISRSDIAHLAKGKEKVVAEIQNALRELGAERLKPIYDRFEGRVPYETIRLARLLFRTYAFER
ncbi:MAG: AAA family ATPase [Candidatus Liptonbacteria bacterium]|nr:AAA family ATPase [Candidatus Liptonbacteria bacterium]